MTYFAKWGFSINEGQFPNIHIRWDRTPGFYIAFSPRLRLWKFWSLRVPNA